MYTDKKNILQLVALLRAHGIKRIVLCPGSRNIPLVQTLANIPDFTCYPVTDERSAGFFALGLALHGGGPAAVCCTSGTALLNLHPAVAEAYYQQVPLVVISADRPAAWIGQMDGQTAMGKAPIGVAGLAKKYGKTVIAFTGAAGVDAEKCNEHGIDAFFPILRNVVTLEEAMKNENAKRNLADTAEQVYRLWRAGTGSVSVF